MARINFEDDVEAQDEFWALLALQHGDRDKTLGRLLRFFRIAQKAYGQNIPLDESDLIEKGFDDMIKSGWAVPVDGGYHALGAEKHFSWYRQKVEAGAKGGRAKAENALAAPSVATAQLSAAYPLALSPSLAPVLSNKDKKEEKFQLTSDNLDRAFNAWLETLSKMKMRRSNLIDREKEAISRAIQRDGVLAVISALRGVANAPKDDFDSSWFSDVTRVLNPKNFLRFVNLGIQQLHKEHNASSDN